MWWTPVKQCTKSSFSFINYQLLKISHSKTNQIQTIFSCFFYFTNIYIYMTVWCPAVCCTISVSIQLYSETFPLNWITPTILFHCPCSAVRPTANKTEIFTLEQANWCNRLQDNMCLALLVTVLCDCHYVKVISKTCKTLRSVTFWFPSLAMLS